MTPEQPSVPAPRTASAEPSPPASPPPPAGTPGTPGPSSRQAFALRWERREPPLPSVAVLALGAAVPGLALAARERIRGGARLAVLADDGPGLSAAERSLLVLGAEADLPWADGVHYLARDEGLLTPTTTRPAPAAALWRRALGAAEGQLCVLVPGRALIADPPVPLGSAEVLDPYTVPTGTGPDGGADGRP